MTIALESVTKYLRRRTAAGAPSTGKVTADWTFFAASTASGTPATYAHGSFITDLGGGYYAWTYTMPSGPSHYGLDQDVASGTDISEVVAVMGECEGVDLDLLNATVSRPLVTVTGQGTIGQITPVAIVNKRYRVLRFAFIDVNGTAINMTAGIIYTNYKWCVRGFPDQTLAPPKLDATNGLATAGYTWSIVGGVGYVDVSIPEDATIFGALNESSVASADSIEHRHELIADMVSPAGETVPLVQSSQLLVMRREGGT